MIWVIFTVICYAISSLGDKYISTKLKCKPAEFAFIVSTATAFWIAILIPFTGWQFEFNRKNIIVLMFLILWKIIEFYSSAVLLKTVSAYELKAWLGINIILSYLCNVRKERDEFHILVIGFSVILILGIIMIVHEQENQNAVKKTIWLCMIYVLAKFFYGLQMGMLSERCTTTSVLFIVMIAVALIQLPRIQIHSILSKKGLIKAAITRIPNAIGLITEAMAALENVFLYAMVQPIQLAILFIFSIVTKESMGKKKLVGSIVCILAVCGITIILFWK